jgi:hypothetical protein
VTARKRANESVDKAREYVKAHIEFVHYVERRHNDSASEAARHGEADEKRPVEEHHEH